MYIRSHLTIVTRVVTIDVTSENVLTNLDNILIISFHLRWQLIAGKSGNCLREI